MNVGQLPKPYLLGPNQDLPRWRWIEVDDHIAAEHRDDDKEAEPFFGGLAVGRRRSADVTLPRDVHRVVSRGKEYFYFHPGRGTKHSGKRVPLGKDTNDPEFWRKLRDAKGMSTTVAGTFSALIAEYRKQHFARLRPSSRRVFNHFLMRIDAEAGKRLVTALARRDIYQMLDGMSATPHSANIMVSVLRTLLEFGVKRGYRDDNPAIRIERIKVEDSGHEPWPEDGYSFVMANAPVYLKRLAFLGRATGQRVSDLVKMRAADLAHDGIFLRITKLRDKPHLVPLTEEQMREIKSWGVHDLDYFITTPFGRRCSANYLNALWNNWRASDAATPIRDLKMTIHGLRPTKIEDLRRDGASDGAISDELHMSVKMVSRYLRFANKIAAARASRDRREQKRDEFVKRVPTLYNRSS